MRRTHLINSNPAFFVFLIFEDSAAAKKIVPFRVVRVVRG